jgi:hypothetical protein
MRRARDRKRAIGFRPQASGRMGRDPKGASRVGAPLAGARGQRVQTIGRGQAPPLQVNAVLGVGPRAPDHDLITLEV